jgi:hypothetical protein
VPAASTPRHDCQDITERTDAADMTEPMLKKLPTESTDPAEPMEPMDRTEPTELIDRIDPLELIESSEPSDRSERVEEPLASGTPPSCRIRSRRAADDDKVQLSVGARLAK